MLLETPAIPGSFFGDGEVVTNGVGGALVMFGRTGGNLDMAGVGEVRLGLRGLEPLEKGSLGTCLDGMLATPGRGLIIGRGAGNFLTLELSGGRLDPIAGSGAGLKVPTPPIGGSGLVVSKGGEAELAVPPSVATSTDSSCSFSPSVVAGVTSFFVKGFPPRGPLPFSSVMDVRGFSGVSRRGIITPGRGCWAPEVPGSLPRARPA